MEQMEAKCVIKWNCYQCLFLSGAIILANEIIIHIGYWVFPWKLKFYINIGEINSFVKLEHVLDKYMSSDLLRVKLEESS